MLWQDIVLTVASVVFSVALVPQIYFGFKNKSGPIKLQTSVPTFIGLYVVAITYYTLSLYLATATAFAAGTLWFVLFAQRILYRKDKNTIPQRDHSGGKRNRQKVSPLLRGQCS